MPAERINTRLKNLKSQSFSRKAHEQAVCGEAETSEGFLKDFWSNSSGGAYFLPEEEYAHRKEHKKTQETGMPDILLQDAANLVRSFSQSCGKFR